MKILIELALNNIKKYTRESILVVISVSLTISLITVVAVIVSSIYASTISGLEQNNPFNAHISGVKNVGKYIDEIREERLLYYEVHSSLEDYYLVDGENTIDLSNLYSVGKTDSTSNLILSNHQLSEGRLPSNKYEIVAVKNGKNKINDHVKIETKNPQRSEAYEATIVGLSEIGLYYTADSDAYASERGHDVFLIFNDGERHIDNTLKSIKDYEIVDMNSYINFNSDYNFFKGMQSTPGTTAFIYSLLGMILVFIIALMTFSLILNSFDTLFTQKEQTFSVLRSVGTTKKQLRRMIMFEGFILAFAGTTIGLSMGIFISKYLIHYISKIIDSVVAIEYGVSQALEFHYFFPSTLLIVIAVISLFVVVLALSIKIRKIYKYSAVETSNKLKIKNKKNQSINKYPVYDMAIINNKSTNNFKGIKIAIMTITTVLILLNSWLSLASNTNEFNKGKYNLFIRGDCFTTCDINQDISKITTALNNIESVEGTLVYYESNSLLIDYDKHTLKNLGVPFNEKHTDGLSLIVMENSEFLSVLKDNKLSDWVKTLLVNKIESFDNDTGHRYEIGNSLDIKDGDMFYVVIDSLEEASISKGIKVDAVVESLDRDSSFLKNYASLLIMDKSSFEALSFGDIELNQPRISVSGDFEIEDFKYINESVESLELSANFQVMSEYVNLYISNIVTQSARFISVVVLSYMAFVIVLNIVNITLTNYRNRKKDIASLRSIGASVKQVQGMLFIESFISVLKSWSLGVILGCIMSYVQYRMYIKNIISTYVPNFSLSGFAVFATFIFVILTLLIILITVNLETRKMNIIEDIKSY